MKDFNLWPEILTISNVQEIMSISKKEACDIFNQPDFPIITPEKKRNKQVGKHAFRKWLNKGAEIYE